MWRPRPLLALVVGLLVAFARADGMYAKGSAVPSEPTVPDQRAIIAWDQGVETLIVESSLRGGKGSYSWILPLPSVPTLVRPARPSVIPFSLQTASPIVRHAGPARTMEHAARATWFLLAAVCGALLWPRLSRPKRLAFLGACLLLAAIASQLSESSWSKNDAAGAATDGLDVTSVLRRTVGSYEVEVVKAGKARDLETWLQRADTPLPPRARPAVEQYIEEGWCFLVAKLRKDQGDDLTPHPILARFPAEQPIYPMRLTQYVSRDLDLDLLVLGPQAATAPGMRLLRNVRFIVGKKHGGLGAITHADLRPFIGNPQFVTRLRGTLSPSQMREDMLIRWRAEAPDPTFATPEAAMQDAEKAAVWPAVAGFALGAATAILLRAGRVLSFALVVAMGSLAGFGSWNLSLKRADILDAEPPSHETDTSYHDAHTVSSAFLAAEKIGHSPFPDRMRWHIAKTLASESLRVWPVPDQEVRKRLPEAARFEHGDIGGYKLVKTGKDQYRVTLYSWQGGERTLEVVDRRYSNLSPAPTQMRVTLVAWPARFLPSALRSGTIRPWKESKLVLERSGSPAVALRWESGSTFVGMVAPGTYFARVKGLGYGPSVPVGSREKSRFVVVPQGSSSSATWTVLLGAVMFDPDDSRPDPSRP